MSDEVAHALAYPFQPPSYGFYLSSDRPDARRLKLDFFASVAAGPAEAPLCALRVTIEGLGGRSFQDRVPVIAAGSNASPARLRSKFAEAGLHADFPVLRAAVANLVPVYSAHISKYGSIPGTLTAEAGARSLLAIAFLSKAELGVVNASEAIGKNYGLALLSGQGIRLMNQAPLDQVLAYVSKRGAFAPQGKPVRISAFTTRGSLLPSAGQRRILHQARRIAGSGQTLEAFIRQHIADDAERLSRTERLAAHAQACAIPGLHAVAGGLAGPPGKLPDWT